MGFVEEVRAGLHGVRFVVPEGFEVAETYGETSVLLVHRQRGFGLQLGLFDVRLDLRPELDELLRRDVERHARDLFDDCFRSSPRPNDKIRPRTEDPSWSPVIECDPVSVDGARALRVLHRLWYEPGRETLLGHLLIPLARGLFELRIIPGPAAMTGMRESVIMVGAMKDSPGEEPEALMKRLAGSRAFDDPKWDDSFPDHPLSVARRELRWLLEEGEIKVLEPAPEPPRGEVVVTNGGFAITPPPRYALMDQQKEAPKRAQWSRVTFAGTDGIALLTVSRTGSRIHPPDARKLAQVAKQLTKESVPEGAEEVRVSARTLPDKGGRKHAETYRAYVEGSSRQHSVFRWIAEADGEVVMIAIGTSQVVPESELAEEAEQVASSFGRVSSEPEPAKKKWWQIF